LVLVGVHGFDEALDLLASAVVPGVRLLAAEMIDDVGMHAIMALDDLPWPLAQQWPYVLLIEVEDGGAGEGLLLDDALDVVAATDASTAQRLWRYRDGQGEAFNSLGITHRLDVSIPFESLARISVQVREAFAHDPEVTAVGVFGHLADGNLHIEVIGPAEDDTRPDEIVLRLVTDAGGSISAEHGVGRQKAPYLAWCRSATEIAAMKAIKSALDPQLLFAQGVIWTAE
jgi:FAD/FMN-containing dehydrogenase